MSGCERRCNRSRVVALSHAETGLRRPIRRPAATRHTGSPEVLVGTAQTVRCGSPVRGRGRGTEKESERHGARAGYTAAERQGWDKPPAHHGPSNCRSCVSPARGRAHRRRTRGPVGGYGPAPPGRDLPCQRGRLGRWLLPVSANTARMQVGPNRRQRRLRSARWQSSPSKRNP